MADDNQNNNGGGGNNQKQKGGGGNQPREGLTLASNFQYSDGPTFGGTIKKAAIEGGSYVVAAGAGALFAKSLNWLINKFTGAPSQPIFYNPNRQSIGQQAQPQGEHPMAMLNRILKEDPSMANKMKGLLDQRLSSDNSAPAAMSEPVAEQPASAMTITDFPVTPEVVAEKSHGDNGKGRNNRK